MSATRRAGRSAHETSVARGLLLSSAAMTTLRPTLLAPLALFAMACAVPLTLTSCGGSEEVLLGRRSEVLAALGTNVILPSYRTLQTRAGLNMTPAFSPDGSTLAYAHGGESGTDLYATNAFGNEPARRITVGRGSAPPVQPAGPECDLAGHGH
mgnify:CR=1 FL=1